eukprot:3936318-Rhodomonas_salina.4
MGSLNVNDTMRSLVNRVKSDTHDSPSTVSSFRTRAMLEQKTIRFLPQTLSPATTRPAGHRFPSRGCSNDNSLHSFVACARKRAWQGGPRRGGSITGSRDQEGVGTSWNQE